MGTGNHILCRTFALIKKKSLPCALRRNLADNGNAHNHLACRRRHPSDPLRSKGSDLEMKALPALQSWRLSK
ncbi:hypothetical protein CEXT_133911 [Caerostris extrusa]|uniref:Uncharacterized protein n=1 Tax=Caerostris extrusa TaxID=172846 RepID=A0AAV4XVS1_CAEEX|nr:hypothetical protein CEXT_133911 [Caerostris extrusa]